MPAKYPHADKANERQLNTSPKAQRTRIAILTAAITISFAVHARLPPSTPPPPGASPAGVPAPSPSPPPAIVSSTPPPSAPPPSSQIPRALPPPGSSPPSAYGPWFDYPDDPLATFTCVAPASGSPRNLDCVWAKQIAEDQATQEKAANLNIDLHPGAAYSPRKWYTRTADARYNPSGPPLMISHRGLVDLYRGIPENTVAAVNNAIANGLYMVEIDVQASADPEVPMALHDDWLTRPDNGNKTPVDHANPSTLSTHPTYIRNPVFQRNGIFLPPYFKGNENASGDVRIRTVEGLFYTVGAPKLGVTFVWDPKNLKAAQALGRLMMKRADIARQSIMKTYSNYWKTENGDVSTAASNFLAILMGATDTEKENLRLMKIMPVVNVIRQLDDAAVAIGVEENPFQPALDYAESDAEAWGDFFEVVAIEYPGAFHQQWLPFVTLDDMKHWSFPHNPIVGGKRSVPMIAAGYRFEDFAIDGQAYDWDMHGEEQVDRGNVGRRTICGQIEHYLPVAKFVTADFPLQEAYCIRKDLRDDGTTAWGNPQARFSYQFAPAAMETDPTVPIGDQDGP